jgi:hypothetical protein
MLIFEMKTKPMHFFKYFVPTAVYHNRLLASDTNRSR